MIRFSFYGHVKVAKPCRHKITMIWFRGLDILPLVTE